MRQRRLSYRTLPCHRRPVIARDSCRGWKGKGGVGKRETTPSGIMLQSV